MNTLKFKKKINKKRSDRVQPTTGMFSKKGYGAHKASVLHRRLADTTTASRGPWVSRHSFGFLQCVMLWQLIMAWQPCLVSAMDSSTIVQAAGAAAGTVIPIVVAAAAVGAVATVCATSENQDVCGNKDHCVTPAQHQQSEVQAKHHPDVSSSTPQLFADEIATVQGSCSSALSYEATCYR